MPFENVHGHGGLLTTTQDLLTWNLLLADPSLVGDRVDNWRKKQGVLKNGKRISYASGITINSFNGQTEISHSGATAGYRGWLAFYPKQKLSVIFLSNDSRFNLGGSARAIAKIFLGAPEDQPRKEPKYIALASKEQQRWAGQFRHNGDAWHLALTLEGGKILSDGNEMKAIHSDTLMFDAKSKLTWFKNDLMFIGAEGDTSTLKKMPPPDLLPNSLKSMVGSYFSDEAETTFKIVVEGTDVYYRRDPDIKEKLKPIFKDAFLNQEYWFFEFSRDKKNQITGATISIDRAQRVSFRKTN